MNLKINPKKILIILTISTNVIFFNNISNAANKGKVIVETGNIREKANTTSTVIEQISAGEEIEILEEENDWYKIKYNGITGYLRKDLVEVKESQEKKEETTSNSVNAEQTNEANAQKEENKAETNVTEENVQKTENNENEAKSTETNNEEATNNDVNVIEVNKSYKVTQDVKLKVIPLIYSLENAEVKNSEKVEVQQIVGEWVKVKKSEAEQGWMRKDNLAKEEEVITTANIEPDTSNSAGTGAAAATSETEQNSNKKEENNQAKTMYVNTQTINLREAASTTAGIVKQLAVNTEVKVISTENGWAKVNVSGVQGYIAENLLSTTKQETSRSATNVRENETAKQEEKKTETVENTTTSGTATGATSGSAIVEYAKKYIGCNYVYGGTSPSGFDCSGFTQYVYKNFGISLNRTAAAQYSNGTSVSRANLQAGDLVMFGKGGINHVGIYIGGDSFVHAANKSRGVTIDTLSSSYYNSNYVGARRIL